MVKYSYILIWSAFMLDVYNKILKEKLTEKRYNHSVNVSKKAVYLARKYGADVK